MSISFVLPHRRLILKAHSHRSLIRKRLINFVQMLAEHYSEEEYDAILKRVADEARLLQRQLVMEDYTGALKDGDAVPGPLVLSPSQSAQQQCERNQSQL